MYIFIQSIFPLITCKFLDMDIAEIRFTQSEQHSFFVMFNFTFSINVVIINSSIISQ